MTRSGVSFRRPGLMEMVFDCFETGLGGGGGGDGIQEVDEESGCLGSAHQARFGGRVASERPNYRQGGNSQCTATPHLTLGHQSIRGERGGVEEIRDGDGDGDGDEGEAREETGRVKRVEKW